MTGRKGLNDENYTAGRVFSEEEISKMQPEKLKIYFDLIKPNYRRKLQFKAALREYNKIWQPFYNFYKGGKYTDREMSIVCYELAFTNFELGHFEKAVEFFTKSLEVDTAAGDEVGKVLNIYMLTHVKCFGNLTPLTDSYQSMLACLQKFHNLVAKQVDVSRASYWLYDIQHHMLTIAVELQDLEEAELRFNNVYSKEKLEDVLQSDGANTFDLRAYRSNLARVEFLRGNYENAMRLFATFLDCGLEEYGTLDNALVDTNLLIEESSKDYLYAGRSLIKLGDIDFGLSLFDIGLAEPEDNANHFFHRLIRQEIAKHS